MFSEMQIVTGQLSLPGWRLLTGLEVLWLDAFGKGISYRDLRGLYQLKKSTGLFVAYFATWGVFAADFGSMNKKPKKPTQEQ